jgi:hypothetical protein
MKLWVYLLGGQKIHTFHTMIRMLWGSAACIANGRAGAADRAS